MKFSIFQIVFLGFVFLLLFYNNSPIFNATLKTINSFFQNIKKNISIKK